MDAWLLLVVVVLHGASLGLSVANSLRQSRLEERQARLELLVAIRGAAGEGAG